MTSPRHTRTPDERGPQGDPHHAAAASTSSVMSAFGRPPGRVDPPSVGEAVDQRRLAEVLAAGGGGPAGGQALAEHQPVRLVGVGRPWPGRRAGPCGRWWWPAASGRGPGGSASVSTPGPPPAAEASVRRSTSMPVTVPGVVRRSVWPAGDVRRGTEQASMRRRSSASGAASTVPTTRNPTGVSPNVARSVRQVSGKAVPAGWAGPGHRAGPARRSPTGTTVRVAAEPVLGGRPPRRCRSGTGTWCR